MIKTKEKKKVGRMSRFLRVFAFLFVSFLTTNLFAAGYVCNVSSMVFTSCLPGAYLTYNGVYNAVPRAGNACTKCPENFECPGGTEEPYQVAVTCEPGYYLPANKLVCEKCPAGKYCVGGTFDYPASSSNRGIASCPSPTTRVRTTYPTKYYGVPTLKSVALSSWRDGISSKAGCVATYKYNGSRGEFWHENVRYNATTDKYDNDTYASLYYLSPAAGYYLNERYEDTYCNTAGHAMLYRDALPCPAGKYCLGRTTQTLCSSGTYETTLGIDGQVTAGYYSTGGATKAASTASNCVAGGTCGTIAAGYWGAAGATKSTGTGNIAAGYYSTGGATTSTPTAAGNGCLTGFACGKVDEGYYSTGGGTKSAPTAAGNGCLNGKQCGKVAEGCYSTGKGSTTSCPNRCEDVNSLFYYSERGSTSVNDCYAQIPAGQYMRRPGYYATDSCPLGSYSSAHIAHYNEVTSCTPCPAGTTTLNTGAISEVACSIACSGDGAEYTYSWKEPSWNTGGYVDNLCVVKTCKAGSVYDTTTNKCLECPVGTWQSVNNHTIHTCSFAQIGYYVPMPGSDSQTPCPAGKYTSTEGQSACMDVNAGYYSTGGGTSATPTAAGNGCLSGYECGTIAAGYYGAAGATTSTGSGAIDGGYYSTGGGTSKEPIAVGDGCVSGYACGKLQPGYYSTGGGTKLQPNKTGDGCVDGYECGAVSRGCYASAYVSVTSCPHKCSDLAGGLYRNSEPGAKSESDCYALLEGKYVASPKSGTATPCPVGKYVNFVSLHYGDVNSCDVCPAGEYNTAEGQRGCIELPAGYWNNGCGTSATGGVCNDNYSGGKVNAGYYSTGGGTSGTPTASGNGCISGKQCGPIAAGYWAGGNCAAMTATPTSASDCATGDNNAGLIHIGFYSTGGGKVPRPYPGDYAEGEACVSGFECGYVAAGYYVNGGGTSATPTSFGNGCVGQWNNNGTMTNHICGRVDAGYYSTGGAITPTPASDSCHGYDISDASNVKANRCGPVAAGYYGAVGATTSMGSGPVDAGYYSTGGGTSKTPTAAGNGCISGKACGKVNAGYYSTGGGTSKTPTAAGNGCISGKACGQVDSGCYAPDAGSTTSCPNKCSDLANGFYPNGPKGSTSANNCYTNSMTNKYVATAGASVSMKCPDGSYKEIYSVKYGSTSTCDVCPTGMTTGANGTCTSECANDSGVIGHDWKDVTFEELLDGRNKCIAASCPSGYSYDATNEKCVKCSAGTYQGAFGFTGATCTSADKGYFVPESGASSQQMCSAGKYTSEKGQSACGAVSAGYWNNGGGTSATPTAAGNGCLSGKQCGTIAAGYYGAAGATTSTGSGTVSGGYYSTNGGTSATPTANGNGCVGTGSKCGKLSAQYYSNGGSTSDGATCISGKTCGTCDANYRANTETGKTVATQCQISCAAGTAVVEKNKACAVLSGGKYKTGTALVNYGSLSPTATDITSGWAVGTVYSCPSSYGISGTTAANHDARTDCTISCPAGTQVASENATCTTPSGTTWYTSGHSVAAGSKSGTNVKTCVSGYTTPNTTTQTDHDAKSDCKISCSAGYAVLKADETCSSIQNATYKGKYIAANTVSAGSTSTIQSCPTYYQDGNGTTAQNQCINSCAAGSRVASANADCSAITSGNVYMLAHDVKYGSTSAAASSCPSSYSISGTAQTDHDAKSDCKISCSAGYAVLKADETCSSIQNATYKGKYIAANTVSAGSTSTIQSCPTYYQDGNGTTAQNQCINSCAAGTQVASANATCTTPSGTTWYTSAHDVKYGSTSGSNVKSCNSGYTTPNTTTQTDHDAVADCKISCEAGYYVPSAGQGCKVCAAGKYCTGASNVAQTATSAVTGDVTAGYYSTGGATTSTGSGMVNAGYWNNGCGTSATGDVCSTSYKGGQVDAGYYNLGGGTSATPEVRGKGCVNVSTTQCGTVAPGFWGAKGATQYGGSGAVRPGYYSTGGATSNTPSASDCAGKVAIIENGKLMGASEVDNTCGQVQAGYWNNACGINATGGVCSTSYQGGIIAAGYWGTTGATDSVGSGRLAPGYYSTGGATVEYPNPNQCVGNNTCGAIDAGYWNNGGGTLAAPTAPGNGCHSDKSCGMVNAGYYSTGGGTSATPTAANNGCLANKSCGKLSAQYYSNGGSTSDGATCISGKTCGTCNANYRANTETGKTSASQCQASCAAGTRVATVNAACTSPAGGWFSAAHLVNYGQISPVNYCMSGYTSTSTSASGHDAKSDCVQTVAGGKYVPSSKINARYIKITSDGSVSVSGSTNPSTHLLEMQAFASNDGSGTNLLSGKGAVAGDKMSAVTNGNWTRGDGYSYGEGSPMILDLGSVQSLGSLKFAMYTDGREYQNVAIAVSEDNTTYTTVFTANKLLTQNTTTPTGELVVLSAAPKSCAAGTSKASGTVALGNTTTCGTCANWTYSGEGVASCTACPAVESGYAKLDSTGTGWTTYQKCVEIATASPTNCASGKLQKIPTASGATTWATATVNANNPLNANPGYIVSGTMCSQCTGATYSAGGSATSCSACDTNYRANTNAGKSNASQCQASCAAGTRVATVNAACTSPAGGWFSAAHLVNYGQISPVNYCMSGYTSTSTSASGHDAKSDCVQTVQGKMVGATTIAARYIKVTSSGSAKNSDTHMLEIQAFASADGTGTNLLSGKGGTTGSKLTAATDGSWTRGTTGETYAQGSTLVWDLGSVQNLGSIKFAMYTDGRVYQNMAISVSENNQDYTTVFQDADFQTQNTENPTGELVVLSAAPWACTPGSYKPSTTVALGNTVPCNLADKGYFVGTTGASSQTKCVMGSYTNGIGFSECKACAGGKTNSADGATSCTATCSNATGVASTGWETPVWGTNNKMTNLCTIKATAGCSANYYKDSNACSTCASGTNSKYTLSDAGTTTVNNCYLNTTAKNFVKTAGAGQTTCEKGNYCPGSVKVYYGGTASDTHPTTGGSTQCPANSYCVAGVSAAAKCSDIANTNGFYPNSDAGSDEAADCKTNSISGASVAAKASASVLCPTGKYGPARTVNYGNTLDCLSCTGATYADQEGMSACETCPTVSGASGYGYWNTSGEAGNHTVRAGCQASFKNASIADGNLTMYSCYVDASADTYGVKGDGKGCWVNKSNLTCNGGYYNKRFNDSTSATQDFTYKTSSELLANVCRDVESGYWSGADSLTRTACATGLTTCGSGKCANEAGDCGRKLHAGNNVIYLRSEKRTGVSPLLHLKVGDKMFYGNMSTSLSSPLKVKYNNTKYSVVNDNQ